MYDCLIKSTVLANSGCTCCERFSDEQTKTHVYIIYDQFSTSLMETQNNSDKEKSHEESKEFGGDKQEEGTTASVLVTGQQKNNDNIPTTKKVGEMLFKFIIIISV